MDNRILVHPDVYDDSYLDVINQTVANKWSNHSVNANLLRHNLLKLDKHKWLKNVQTKLVVKSGYYCEDKSKYGWDKSTTQILEIDDLNQLIDVLLSESKVIDSNVIPRLSCEKKLVALDLETTGLDTTFRLVGGKIEHDVNVVGIVVAPTENVSYYIPTKHNELDGISNWEESEWKEFLKVLQSDKFFCVYHNAMYDLSVMRLNGIIINTEFSDTAILNQLMNNFEFFPYHVRNGLKPLSAYVLNRDMIEINQLFGLPKKSVITMDTIPAVNAEVYSASDGCNTLALFLKFVVEDKYKRNPYKHQPLIVNLEMKHIYHLIGVISHGFPLDYDRTKKSLLTVIRRIILLSKRLNETIGYECSLTSDEQVGMAIGKLLTEGWKGDIDQLATFMSEETGMNIKQTTLKSGQVKVTFSTGDDVLNNLYEKVDSFSFVSESNSEKIKRIIDILHLSRSLDHERAIFLAMVRNAKADDRNFSYIDVGLRPIGTDTGRLASSKGAGVKRVSITPLKTKIKGEVKKYDGLCSGFNSQGVPTRPFISGEAYKIVSMPSDLKNKLDLITKEVLVDYHSQLLKV